MASLSELASATQTGPAEAFRSADIEYQKYQLQSQGLQDQAKELADDRAQALEGAATGQPLAGMTNQLLPGAKLVGSDGLPTVAGQMNSMLAGAQGLAKQGKQLISSANTIPDPVQRAQVLAEGRRMIQNAQTDAQKAQKMHQDTMNDSIYAAATAKNPQEWDNAVKAYQASGLPLPQGIPLDYSPENVKKIAALAPAALQSKINNDLIKREQDARAEQRAERLSRSAIAKEQGGMGGPSKVYDTLEEKVADPSYGVAKGKIPAKEQTIARRINTDAKEVVQGVDQVMTLTNGGMRDTTGTTFANVKDTGLLTAPVKFFTNKISDKDSQMYDAMMYPLVKGIALYANPDYRPTEADVQNAMKSYKANSGQPQSVQLEKMAELKKNFLAASESYLDSSILNPQQANSLKQQVKAVEKAIPWCVNDVVDFTRQKTTKDFKTYLSSKGELPAEGAKPAVAKVAGPQTIATQEQYDALPSGSIYIEDGKRYKKP